jgi:YD repeat-containing protein
MILRGNLRELLKKLRRLSKSTLVPIAFLLVFFLVAGFFAITQETEDRDNPRQGDSEGVSLSPEDEERAASPEASASPEAGIEPEFIPANHPPRWFRSNAGGMAIEELSSRLGALSNKYALLIDYVSSDELDPRLLPFYKDEYIIEIRILYKEKKESRKQWLLRDKDGNTRINAVFRLIEENPDEPALAGTETGEADDILSDGAMASDDKKPEDKTPGGFIEVFNENGRISRDYSLFEDSSEILTAYFYSGSALIKAETQTKDADSLEYRKTLTDNYRYNRSYSLRYVERVFHEFGIQPVRLVFPGRVLDAANEKNFLKERLTFTSDFLGGYPVDAGFRVVYDTDSKGRVVGEILYNGKNEVVWTMKNTWAGDRIIAILKTEDGDERLIEFDYDGSGNRIAERDIRNGILERKVLINGGKETEELYMDGVLALRAFWEDGRKISEERVRRR